MCLYVVDIFQHTTNCRFLCYCMHEYETNNINCPVGQIPSHEVPVVTTVVLSLLESLLHLL
jgi:hypothetical protein